jgi:hypothetical protein
MISLDLPLAMLSSVGQVAMAASSVVKHLSNPSVWIWTTLSERSVSSKQRTQLVPPVLLHDPT